MHEAKHSVQGDQRTVRLILLPGMDGTGQLFFDFLAALPRWIVAEIVRFPAAKSLSYRQLEGGVRSIFAGPGPFVLLGESFSSPLAVRLAASAPEGLCGVVLCAGFVTPPVGGIFRAIAWWIAPAACWAAGSLSVAHRILLGSGASPELIKSLRDSIRSVKVGVMADRLRAVLRCDATDELRRVQVPILYVAGTNDRLVGEPSLRLVQKIRPDVQIARIGGPHLIVQRKPSETAMAIVEFIEEIV